MHRENDQVVLHFEKLQNTYTGIHSYEMQINK